MSVKRLAGKTAIITGAANGIGRATALLFAKEGAELVITDINEQSLAAVQAQIESAGGTSIAKRIDVSVEAEIKSTVDLAIEKYSKVDILVNNAGIAGMLYSLEEQNSEEWLKIFNVNIMGPVYATKHVISHMKERKQGSIVNIASIAGIRSGAGGNPYSASKAALINFTQTSACEVGSHNVRINAVCPGLIETDMTRPFFSYAKSIGKESRIGNKCELMRAAQPDEVAMTILFLASEESSYITGQAIAVDGGITASVSLPGKKI